MERLGCVWGVCKCGRVGLRWGGVSALVLGEGSGVKHVFSNLDWGGEWGVQHLHSNLYLGRGVGCATLSSQERAHFFFHLLLSLEILLLHRTRLLDLLTQRIGPSGRHLRV